MEPTLSQMDDYNGNESLEKRRTVYMVIGLLLALGLGYTMIKTSLDSNMGSGAIPYQYQMMK
jgi:hypothetical protein